jgi:hypothetical protein
MSDTGLLTVDEEQLLRRITTSKVWRLIQDALVKTREDLFAGFSTIAGLDTQPTTQETLWINRGAILLAQHLLREGPLFVIWYQRHMAAETEAKALQKASPLPEREYEPSPFREKPDFDL